MGLFLYSSLGICCWRGWDIGLDGLTQQSQSDVLTTNSSKFVRTFVKISDSREMVGLKILWLSARLKGVNADAHRAAGHFWLSSVSLPKRLVPALAANLSQFQLLFSAPVNLCFH